MFIFLKNFVSLIIYNLIMIFFYHLGVKTSFESTIKIIEQ